MNTLEIGLDVYVVSDSGDVVQARITKITTSDDKEHLGLYNTEATLQRVGKDDFIRPPYAIFPTAALCGEYLIKQIQKEVEDLEMMKFMGM